MNIKAAHTEVIFFPSEQDDVGNVDLDGSRYTGTLALTAAAGNMGFIKAVEVLDIKDEIFPYTNLRMYNTNFLSIASGKQRLSHVDELVDEEFKAVCGGKYPKKSTNHEYMDRIVEKDDKALSEGKESIIESFLDESSNRICKSRSGIRRRDVY